MEFLVNLFYYLANGLAVFISAYVGLLKEDKMVFKMTPKANVTINRRQLMGVLFACVLLSFILSFKRDSISDKKLSDKEKQHQISDSLRDDKKYKQFAELESQHTQEMKDALFTSDEKHSKQLQSNTDSFLRISAQYNNSNEKEHKTTQKKVDSIVGKDPPLVKFIPGSNCGFTYIKSNDSSYFTGFIQNMGDRIAFFINADVYLITGAGNQLVRPRKSMQKIKDHDLASYIMTKINAGFTYNDSNVIKGIDNYTLVVIGYYFIDYYRKNKRDLCLGFTYTIKDRKYNLLEKEDAMKSFNSASTY